MKIIIEICKRKEYRSIAIYSPENEYSRHVKLADEAYALPGGGLEKNYLNVPLILEIAKKSGTTGVHPGYGFISENASAAKLFEETTSFGLDQLLKTSSIFQSNTRLKKWPLNAMFQLQRHLN